MISSDSINFSKYSMIGDNNNNQSTDLEIIESKDNSSQNHDKEELSKVLLVTKEHQEDNSKNNKNNELIYKIGNIYGNSFENLTPKYIGKSRAFFFDNNGNPRITIGPDCKLY